MGLDVMGCDGVGRDGMGWDEVVLRWGGAGVRLDWGWGVGWGWAEFGWVG